jgi:hypothetical protein
MGIKFCIRFKYPGKCTVLNDRLVEKKGRIWVELKIKDSLLSQHPNAMTPLSLQMETSQLKMIILNNTIGCIHRHCIGVLNY